jgi:oligopeptide/dipeptide ABC transporter ATP-binding protein
MTAVIEAAGLAIDYVTNRGTVRALDGADVTLEAGRSLGLVGESGSGKTTLGMAAGRLLPANAYHVEGSLLVAGRPIFALNDRDITALRRALLGFIFQSPMSALNPTARIGRQMAWALGGRADVERIHTLLRQVGLTDVKRVTRAFPHELSGGMAQRVVIAMAIARRPRLLIADEPTASLDASIRGQILNLLQTLRKETGAALLLLSHELSVVAQHCDSIGVMYGGRVVEFGSSREVFARPVHPYTRALLRAAPGKEGQGERLSPIPGATPVLSGPSLGCSFAPRCPLADDHCRRVRPVGHDVAGRRVACHHAEAAASCCPDTRAERGAP